MRNALTTIGSAARRVGRNRLTAALLGGALVLMIGGGTAVASGHIGSEDIKDGSILRKDLHPDYVMADINNVWWGELAGRVRPDINNVYSSEIVNGTIQSEDMSDEAKSELKGVTGMETHKPADAITEVGPGQTVTATATCEEGRRALSGGYHIKDASQEVRDQAVVTKSGPGPDDTYDGTNFGGWEVVVTNSGDTGSFNVYPYVVCADVD